MAEVSKRRVHSAEFKAKVGMEAAYWTTFAQAHRSLLRAMRDQGVQVMAGIDANTAGVVPGFSLHDELPSLNKAGLSPAQRLARRHRRARRADETAGRPDRTWPSRRYGAPARISPIPDPSRA